MKMVCKIAWLALLMNTLPGIGQERVSYKTVQVNGLNIFYREAGPANGPVILLLHGVPTSSRMYQPMLESSLSHTYRLIAPDFPGFGHSSWPSPKEFSYTFDNLAQVTEKFAEALNLRRYTLFLHDYGGPVGMRMAAPSGSTVASAPSRPPCSLAETAVRRATRRAVRFCRWPQRWTAAANAAATARRWPRRAARAVSCATRLTSRPGSLPRWSFSFADDRAAHAAASAGTDNAAPRSTSCQQRKPRSLTACTNARTSANDAAPSRRLN